METATVTVAADGSETTLGVGGSCAIGRSQRCDLVVDSDRVSRQHLLIEPSGDGWSARDRSANGTWLNGEKITVVRVEGEQRFRLGAANGPEVVVTTAAATVTGDEELATQLGPGGVAKPATAPEQESKKAAFAAGAFANAPSAPNDRTPDARGPSTAMAPAARPQADAAPTPKKKRTGRRLGIAVLVLLVILVAADRVGARVAASQMVSRIESSQQLPSKPSVSVGGFPFLTQVAFGRYTDLGVTIRGLDTPGPRISTLVAHLKGVHVPLSDAIADKVGKVPVDRVVASVFLSYDDLNAYLATQDGKVKLSSSDGELQVSSDLIGGIEVPVPLPTGQLSANGDTIQLLGGALSGIANVDIPLGQLPFKLQLGQIRVHDTTIEITAKADELVLDAK